MKTRLQQLFWAFLLLAQAACSQSTQPVLSGKVTPDPDWKNVLYLVKPNSYTQIMAPYEGQVVDSAAVAADGTFAFSRPDLVKEKGLYALFCQPVGSKYKNGFVPKPVEENVALLVLAPGQPTVIKGDIRALSRSYQLDKAHPESRQLAWLRSLKEPFWQEWEKKYGPGGAEADQSWAAHGSPEIMKQEQAALAAFLDTASALIPAVVAARQYAPDNEFMENPEMAIAAQQRLSANFPGHPWLTQWAVYLQPEKIPVVKGEKMPDFNLPDTNGKLLTIKDVKSKLLVVDFWASWCAPCRKEIRETLVPMYAQWHDKGFNVVGISIDSDKSSWLNALKKDGVTWPNVCDLQGDASPVRDELRFKYIPCNYVLDSEGRLLARNLHGDTLQAFVADYLGK